MLRTALLAALILCSLPARAADEFIHEPQGWFGFFGQKKLENSVFVFWLDLHGRLHGSGQQTNLLIRPGVGVRFHPSMVAWLGYAWTPLIRAGEVATDEHRLWQQWTWDIALDNTMKLQLRSRLEERISAGQVGLRFRQFFRVQSPRYGRAILAAWDEVFLAFNDTAWGQQAGFDQNRVFAGVGLFITEQVRVEGGYMNQLVHRRDTPDPVRHVAMVNLFASW